MEIDDPVNNYNTTNNVRHISTMPRQSTQKRSGGSKGRKISHPNSNSKTNLQTEPSKVSTRFNSSSQINRKSTSSNQSYSNTAGCTKGKKLMSIFFITENLKYNCFNRNIHYNIFNFLFVWISGRNNSQGSSQNYPSKYSSLTLDREKVRNIFLYFMIEFHFDLLN